jgi:hypothetical protein
MACSRSECAQFGISDYEGMDHYMYVCSQGVIRLAGEGEAWDVHSSQLEYSSAASAPLANSEPQLHVVFYKGKQITPRRQRRDTRRT